MSTTLKHTNPCPNCGRGLPVGALSGLCPACLLAQGVGTDPTGAAHPPRFEPPSVEEIARLFPQLEILGLLGAGGMGAVYKARQPVLDRLVALKILPAHGLGDAPFAERFNREARALARLSHPNIVAVHEFGRVAGLHYFLMEFVDGANLRQLERAGRLTPREALQLVPQICDALQYAHDEGVVHRDIKPENVLVDRKGRVKIADFGLAKIMDQNPDSHRLTREGQVMGTPHYMAPEQFERPLSVDHRADIYALGVVLYEMLTGDLPLGNFSPPSRKVTVDVRFDEVVLRALENDPARRYQHASEVKSRVETIAGTPTSEIRTAPSNPLGERCLRWGRFPLVIEREGQRRIHWRGVSLVFLVNFGVLSLLFGLVTLVTGTSLWGWLGVKGWPSVVVRLGLAAGCVAFEVRRVLRRPAGEEACTEWASLPVSPPARGWLRGAMAGGLVVVGVGMWVWFQVNWLTPKLKVLTADLSAAQVAVPDSGTGALVATLPNGGAVELLAIAEADAAPNQWWRPDGRRLTNETFEVRGPADMAAPGRQKMALAFRVDGLPRDAESVLYEFDPGASVSVGGEVRQDGKAVAGGWPMRVAWPAAATTATVRLGYLLDPWRTIATQNPGTYAFARTNRAGDPDWTAGFNHFSDDGTNTYLTVVLGPAAKDWRMRVIAVGLDGVERLHQRASGTPTESSTTWTLTFADLTKAQIQEFRVQVRPVHWVEFRDVALRPVGVEPRSAAPTFGAVQELTFDGFLDFDTGRIGTLPPGNDQAFNPFEVTTELLAWMQQNGFDASAGAEKLETLGVTVVDLAGSDWASLSPEALTRRLREQGRFPTELRPSGHPAQPATFGYRTREGGIGLLQLVNFDAGRPGATVRIRRVENPGTFSAPDVPVPEVRVEADGSGPFPTVQAALDAAAPGAVIRLGAGRFAESLRITKPVSLIGASWTQTVLGPRESARSAGDESRPPVVRISGSGEVNLTGLKFTQPGVPPDGRLLPGAVLEITGARTHLRECAVLGGPGNGIVASAGAEVRMERCLVAAMWNSGIRILAPARLDVTGSDFRNCHYAGIQIGPGATATVRRCRISGAAWHGVRYDDASPELTDNLIFANARSGIYASGATRATLRGNVFLGNEMDGISCWFNNTDQIVGNTFSANEREGLSVLGASSPLIASNIFHRHGVALRQGLIGASSAAATNLGNPVIRGNVFWENRTNWQGSTLEEAATRLGSETFGESFDPQFRDAPGGDFTLGASSPARAAGAGAAEPLTSISPFPLQPEELAIIPSGSSRDFRQWKRVAQP